VLTGDGVGVQPEKVKTVENWPTPRNLTELRSFVGLCSYYRRFITGFASIAAPLHALTRKNARFSWGPDQEEAFNKLKNKLVTTPILDMPRDNGTFYLYLKRWPWCSFISRPGWTGSGAGLCLEDFVKGRTKL